MELREDGLDLSCSRERQMESPDPCSDPSESSCSLEEPPHPEAQGAHCS